MGQNMDMTLNAPLLSFVQLLANLSIDFNAQQFQGFFFDPNSSPITLFSSKISKKYLKRLEHVF